MGGGGGARGSFYWTDHKSKNRKINRTRLKSSFNDQAWPVKGLFK